MSEVAIQHITKTYGPTRAVDDVSLAIAKGELLAVLGPSGCGKTTMLRMVAGFVEPDSGAVNLRGRDITRMPPHQRDAGMVFQSYALFPHLSVAENIAFGLKRRGVAKAEIAARVTEMTRLLRLDGLADRLPRQLSGGQQQRVAVGRALVINPAVILLDEPFSNLDAQLRETTRVEMRRLQQDLSLTAMFVTHDQAEAMAIADRIAIMNRGRLEQIGSPTDIYEKPATRFVASFIGRANIYEVTRHGAIATAGPLRFTAPAGAADKFALVLRPEFIVLEAGTAAEGVDRAVGVVDFISFLGPTAQLIVRLADGTRLLVEGPGDLPRRHPPGSPVVAHWAPQSLVACPLG